MDFLTKTKTEINQTNHKELKDYASKITMAFTQLKADHEAAIEKLDDKLTQALNAISSLTKRTIYLETQLIEQNQYGRNRQIEL